MVDPRWLFYLPAETATVQNELVEGDLEHPQFAFDYYRMQGLQRLHVVQFRAETAELFTGRLHRTVQIDEMGLRSRVERMLLDYRHQRIVTSDARFERLKAKYFDYRETHDGRKPIYYPDRHRWTPLPAEFLRLPLSRNHETTKQKS